MDINELTPTNQDEGAIVHFRDSKTGLVYDGEGENKKPVTALVAGEYSDRHKAVTRKLTEKSLKRQDVDVDAEILAERTIDIQAACIISWDFTANGKPLPVSATNWAAIVKRKPEFQKQVAAAIYSYSSFFDKPSAA